MEMNYFTTLLPDNICLNSQGQYKMTPLFFFQDLTCLFESANHSDDVAPAFLKHGHALVAKVVINIAFSSETT